MSAIYFQIVAAVIPLSESRIKSSSAPETPVSFQNPADPLFISFRFFDVFSKQPFRAHYIPHQPPPASRSPIFRLFFTQNLKPDPLPRLFHFSLFTLPLHSLSTQAVELSQFPQHPRPSNPPASKNSYSLSFQHFQPPPPPKTPAFSAHSRTPAPK